MDNFPSPSRRLHAIAANLSELPLELIEPVIKLLPLHRLLNFTCLRFYRLRTNGPRPRYVRIRDAIAASPAWAWLFRDTEQTIDHTRLDRLERLWMLLNSLSWLWCRQPLSGLPVYRSRFDDLLGVSATAYRNCSDGERLILDLEIRILETYNEVIGIRQGMAPSTSLLAALCRYLPKDTRFPTHVDGISKYDWTLEEAQDFLPILSQALRDLNRSKSEELTRLAKLHEAFPDFLKTPLAPQASTRHQHTLARLHGDAKLVLGRGIARPGKMEGTAPWSRSGTMKNCRSDDTLLRWRFRYPHPPLVPFDWCLTLFQTFVRNKVLHNRNYPDHLLEHIDRAIDGFEQIYDDNGRPGRFQRVEHRSTDTVIHLCYRWQRNMRGSFGNSDAELRWLESFCKCVNWMKTNYPKQAAKCQELVSVLRGPRPLLEPADYLHFVEFGDPSFVAAQLQADMVACEAAAGQLPSLLALYVPDSQSPEGMQIASYILPRAHSGVRRMIYEEMVKKIKVALQRQDPTKPFQQHEDGHQLAPDLRPLDKGSKWNEFVDKFKSITTEKSETRKKCYICRYRIETPHETFSSMCEACGEFNLAGRSLSLPENLNLHGKAALVTGGRVNLGYHTALRLLRCGARVIVSTRYPQDSAARYGQEVDFDMWKDNLKVIGADFRAAGDAFALVAQIRGVLNQWECRLDILVNNAAQTLTDSVKEEQRAVGREVALREEVEEGPNAVVLRHGYVARVRGGATAAIPGNVSDVANTRMPIEATKDNSMSGMDTTLDLSQSGHNMEIDKPPEPSSWVQSLTQIPYEDVITAHSINTFVPLILIRELLPHMTQCNAVDRASGAAAGYIVNVSSREGIFENSPKNSAKSGKHVHTNMSKAGLNMITETEAATTWEKYRVAMNTVDPGYMSAAPEMADLYHGERPIGWEDGAGRVLWPIAVGEMAREQRRDAGSGKGKEKERQQMKVVRGRFLKHYGAFRVDIRFGRG